MTRVLVVEDSPTQAQRLRLILEAEDFSVDVAVDGEAALARLASEAYDLVVSDVLMPRVSGFDLCRRIKADPRLADVPVVLVTAQAEAMEIIEAVACGADNFIRKPYEAGALVERLRSVLANRDLRASGDKGGVVEIAFLGKRFDIASDKRRILQLLVSTFEDMVRTNLALRESEAELLAAKEDLEQASRMKDDFLATLSHELRTPLSNIVGWVHILRAGSQPPAMVARALDVIQRSADSQNRLIGDLLDVSRIIAGKLHMEMAPMNLLSIVTEAADTARPATETRGVELAVVCDASSLPVRGDAVRLQQMVTNLMTNAVKFTPKGGRVTLHCREDRDHVELVVSDTGAGIPQDALHFVFDRFRQARSTDASVHGGLGLGLAIVKHIVDEHGGTVEAHSDGPGRGATFTVRLPLLTGDLAR